MDALLVGRWAQPTSPFSLHPQFWSRRRLALPGVVLTECGHAGVVNTVRYARRLTGVARVHAIVGGFHLNGPLFEPIIAPTCDALAELDPDYLVPTHCTGWRAIHALAAGFPDAYLQASVGALSTVHERAAQTLADSSRMRRIPWRLWRRAGLDCLKLGRSGMGVGRQREVESIEDRGS